MTPGERLVSQVDKPLGHLSKPMTYSQIVEKFMDCAKHAAYPIQKDKLEELVNLVDRLEDVPNVVEVTALLSGHI